MVTNSTVPNAPMNPVTFNDFWSSLDKGLVFDPGGDFLLRFRSQVGKGFKQHTCQKQWIDGLMD